MNIVGMRELEVILRKIKRSTSIFFLARFSCDYQEL